jgi:hypothetical protein
MRYLVRARVKPCRAGDLLEAIEDETLGQGSVAEGEYLRNMQEARLCDDQTVRWVEVCYCPTPLQEERPYWEEYFDLERVQDAHDRRKCRDENGSEPWACGECDCTARLEQKLKSSGSQFLESLRSKSASHVSRCAEIGLRHVQCGEDRPVSLGQVPSGIDGVGDGARESGLDSLLQRT